MTNPVPELEPPDQRGAVEELAHDPASRKQFLKMVGGSGAVAAFGTFLAACGDDGNGDERGSTLTQTTTQAPPAKPGADLDIVNYALLLEYVEADFYKKVIASGLFKGKQLDLLKAIGDHEQQHVAALTATVGQLGGVPVTKPQTRFPLTSATSVANLAATVENLGAAAYLGQAANIKDKAVLSAALAIHTVEGRHAAALNQLTDQPVTPEGAFAKPASMAQVLPKVKPFIVS